ncbi:Stp1/IreP family PP2C-type Ser/Thr phosphatase [[Clostridium] polysaccharolyticum]|uniref:Protein phosphatase n=1 Tax=[Clostridium] polysaccharolyticum TaxID=29364 RepID=A0A1H9Y0S6_9FIRM|nr:Stp1/IreP family PP2C-type Ser/Thr phosphatase [[Clostridium] polysaccharolyticum]SES62272.1 protein phosphatase [[Clostridium] polysaccharolyticum]
MKAFSITDIGMQRKVNQDYVYCSEAAVGSLPNLYIVADGMGGHKAGDYASRCCVESMIRSVTSEVLKSPVSILEHAIQNANAYVLEQSKTSKEYEGMGTTVVAATIVDNILHVGNIGDSRLYLIRDKIEQITEDHSLVETMVRTGELMPEDARFHPNKNIITRALGTNKEVKADFFEVKLEKADTILLCSDGLSNMVEDEEIERIVKQMDNIKETSETLVDLANKNGGADNIAIVMVRI